MECCKWHIEPEFNIPVHRNRRYEIVGTKSSLWPQSADYLIFLSLLFLTYWHQRVAFVHPFAKDLNGFLPCLNEKKFQEVLLLIYPFAQSLNI